MVRFIDEYEGDENGENLLGEPREIFHQDTALYRHHDRGDDTDPKASERTECHEVYIRVLAELKVGINKMINNIIAASHVT